MERFPSAYQAEVADMAERMKKNQQAALAGGFAIGEDFAVTAPDDRTIRDLSSSGLLILDCNPNHRPTGDTTEVPAPADGCALTDEFVS